MKDSTVRDSESGPSRGRALQLNPEIYQAENVAAAAAAASRGPCHRLVRTQRHPSRCAAARGHRPRLLRYCLCGRNRTELLVRKGWEHSAALRCRWPSTPSATCFLTAADSVRGSIPRHWTGCAARKPSCLGRASTTNDRGIVKCRAVEDSRSATRRAMLSG